MNAGTAAEELLPGSLVGLKKCKSAKCLPRVEVAKGACYVMQCLCVTMYKRHSQMGNVRELYIRQHYVIHEILEKFVSRKFPSTRYMLYI